MRKRTAALSIHHSRWGEEERPASTDQIQGMTAMTLIVSVRSYCGTLQMSDRLLSRGGEPWDPESNKTIVLSLSNAIVSISYSGPAYIEGFPTDQWIVQRLTGVLVETSPYGGLASAYGENALGDHWKLGNLLHALQRELKLLLSHRARSSIEKEAWPLSQCPKIPLSRHF